jgi:hypothetical protein
VKLFLALLLLFATDDFASIQRKMDDIVNGHVKRGEKIYMPQRELDAYLRAQAQAIAPKAVHNTKVEPSEGGGTVSANVNFLELNKARGGQSNWMMEKLLVGDRLVKVTVHIQTDHGKARVNVDRVEVGGAAIQGAPLDYMIQSYVLPQFPNAKVDQWFTMDHHMDRIDIHPAGATVIIAK